MAKEEKETRKGEKEVYAKRKRGEIEYEDGEA
jgi:hypothetical protein